MWYMIRNLRYTVTIDSVLANSKTQNAFLFTVNAIFHHDYPLVVEPGSTPRPMVQKKTWRDSLPIDMLLSAVSVLAVAQSSSEIPEGLMNNPVYLPFFPAATYKMFNYQLGGYNGSTVQAPASTTHHTASPLAQYMASASSSSPNTPESPEAGSKTLPSDSG